MKIKSSRNGEITMSTTDIGKSYPSREIFRSLVCLLTLFAKIKFSRKFLDLQYLMLYSIGYFRSWHRFLFLDNIKNIQEINKVSFEYF